jgi:hypothetical protein
MGDPTSSYTTACIALRVSGALKPHHYNKVETPSVGKTFLFIYFFFFDFIFELILGLSPERDADHSSL